MGTLMVVYKTLSLRNFLENWKHQNCIKLDFMQSITYFIVLEIVVTKKNKNKDIK